MLSTDGDLDKVTRAMPAVVRMESDSIYFRKDAHWLPEYEDELVYVTSYVVRCLVETFAEDESEPFIIGIRKLMIQCARVMKAILSKPQAYYV